MAIKRTSTIDLNLTKKRLLGRQREALARAAAEISTAIVARTTRGLSYTGEKFAPYSQSYFKQRSKEGRSTSPDLTRTGKMLQSIATDVIEEANQIIARIFFNSPDEAEKARWNQEGSRARLFFGLAKSDRELVRRYLKGVLNG